MSSFYDDASLVVIPSGYKTSKIYAEKPTDGSGDLTFTRASDATRVASNGLIEKVRTNIYPYGSNVLTSHWPFNSAGTTLTQGQTDPNGGTTAMRIQFAAAATNYTYFAYATTPNIPLTRSVYIKGASAQTIQLADPSGTGAKNINITTSWARYDINFPTSGVGTYGIYFQNVSDAAADFTIAFIQIETGDIATDYIPTTTAAVSVGPVSNVPRLDYLGSSCPRLLLEPQRTNVVTYSESFDNAAFTKGQCSITANAATAPDGTLSADKLVENTSNDAHVVYRNPGGTDATFSFFAKAAGRNWVGVLSNNGNISFFNIGNGTLGTIQAGSTATITPYSNGWYRCTLFNTHPSFGVSIYLATANGTETYTGDGTSGAYIWGAQLEAGAYATSYIPSLNSATTRVADAASKTGISSLIGQTEGTIYAEIVRTQSTATDAFWIDISDNSANNWIFMGTEGTAGRFYVRASNIVAVDNGNPLSVGTHKLALAYKSGSIAGYIDGVQIFTSAATFTIGSLTGVNLGASSQTTAAAVNTAGAVNQALLFKTRLTNAQLAELTTL
jgi:hypothetical protein